MNGLILKCCNTSHHQFLSFSSVAVQSDSTITALWVFSPVPAGEWYHQWYQYVLGFAYIVLFDCFIIDLQCFVFLVTSAAVKQFIKFLKLVNDLTLTIIIFLKSRVLHLQWFFYYFLPYSTMSNNTWTSKYIFPSRNELA